MSKITPKGVKVFTDGEVLARAKNRHEERTLNLHLKHLQEKHHVLEDSLKKEKQYLLEIRRNTFKTSGRSPLVEDLYCQGNISMSKSHQVLSMHFRKPWAFTFAETSYNAVYNDPFDPYTCMYRRPSVRDSSPILPRVGCKSAPAGSRQGSKSPNVCRPVTSFNHRNNITSPEQKHHAFHLQTEHVKDGPSQCADRKEDGTDVVQYGTQRPHSAVRKHTHDGGQIMRTNRKQRSLSVARTTRGGGAVQMLPEKQRSHSVAGMEYRANPLSGFDEVDFNNQTVCSLYSASALLEKAVPETAVKSTIEQVNSNQTNNQSKSDFQYSKKVPVDVSSNSDSARGLNEGVTICDEDVDPSVDTSKDDKSYILFKGQKIHNYVRPQDRYRHDPFKEVRRESLVRKVSIENPVFLNGCRETNFNFGLNFPKSARDRALRQLVETNTITAAERRRQVFNNASLQRRVEDFCQSKEV